MTTHKKEKKTLGQIAYGSFDPEMAKYTDWSDPNDFANMAWEAAAQAVRNAVIEECAKMCDSEAEFMAPMDYCGQFDAMVAERRVDAAKQCAHSIRGLKKPLDKP